MAERIGPDLPGLPADAVQFLHDDLISQAAGDETYAGKLRADNPYHPAAAIFEERARDRRAIAQRLVSTARIWVDSYHPSPAVTASARVHPTG